VVLLPVHPRWRGEHRCAEAMAKCPPGSSPLARGTQGGQRLGQACGRFIPAGAGNTRLLASC